MPPRRRSAQEPVPRRRARGRRPRGLQALVLVDGSKLRRAARKRYEAARRKLDAARGDIERFHTLDEPAYSRWVALKFGPLLMEAREVTQRCDHASRVVQQVRLLAIHHRVSQVQAYGMWKATQAAGSTAAGGEPRADDPGASGRAEQQSREESRDESWREEEPDPFGPGEAAGSSLDDMFEDLASMILGRLPRDDKQIKAVYRKLARKLHPDAGAVMSEENRVFWQRAQEAYDNRDLDALELVLQMVEDQEEALRAQTSVSTLRRLTEGVQRALRSLRRELSDCRQSPAWNCSAHPPGPGYESALRVSFSADLQRARGQLETLEDTIAQWERDLSAAPPPPARRRRMPRAPRAPHIDPRQDTFDLF